MRWTLSYIDSNQGVQLNLSQDKELKCSNWAGLSSLICLTWPLSIRDLLQPTGGSCWFESKNPNTLREPHCNRHCYSEILLPLSVIFSFSVFHVILCVYVGFSLIWLYSLHCFGAWIDSLGFTHYTFISNAATPTYAIIITSVSPPTIASCNSFTFILLFIPQPSFSYGRAKNNAKRGTGGILKTLVIKLKYLW